MGRGVAPHAIAVAWRLALVAALLELLYVLAANVALKTSLLKDYAARGDDLRVDYTSAYSVIPGRIEVRGLRVRFHDRNVEFLIGVEQGTLDVSLHELAMRRFHALRVDGKKVSYRMRHKVTRVGAEGPRLAAYPPIPGFADPPLYAKGEDRPAPPIPERDYHLWDVKVEGVHAEVAEVWVLEYRYRGPGLATGSFRVKPARYYDVPRATLELSGGSLTLGDRVVAKEARLAIDCRVSGSDPNRLQGLEPIRNIWAGARGRFEAMDLAFLDAYLGPRLGASADGRARLDVELRVEQGVVAAGSSIELVSTDARFAVASLRGSGPVAIGLHRPARPAGANAPFELSWRSERLDLGVSGAGGTPRLENVDLRSAFTPDLTRPVELVRAELGPTRLVVPDLGELERALPFARRLPELSGRALLVVQAEKQGAGPVRGGFLLSLADASVTVGGRRTLPWNATLKSVDLEGRASEAPALRGTLALHVDRSSALLPLVSPSPFLRRLEERLLKLGTLDARAKVSWSERARLELVEARSGIARARGHLEEEQSGLRGRFLLSSPVGNVGFSITPTKTDTELFVGDDWLASEPSGRATSPRVRRIAATPPSARR